MTSVLVSRLISPEHNESAQHAVGGGIMREREETGGREIIRLASPSWLIHREGLL